MFAFTSVALVLLRTVQAAIYTPYQVPYNLNQNQTAVNPLDYWGQWENHNFHPSPDNWREPCYTIILDKWVDGDPTNNNANGTIFEFDYFETGFRNGGDITGLMNSLDYLQGMGIKTVYVSGTPFLNQPWQADQYSPLDYTLLDPHTGTIQQWRDCISEMHRRDMLIVLDLTVATLADLVGFKGFLNTSTSFSLYEHDAMWKSTRQYPDFSFANEWDENCTLPMFWGDDGGPVLIEMEGCYTSEFDQYGDTEAFGVHPNWQRQLSKFASVQDRLRDWNPSVAAKLNHFACILIAMLDVDGYRLDKATQMTVSFLANWSSSVRTCAARFNKKNFYIPGEITGGDAYGSIYIGRGRQPDQRPRTGTLARNLTGKEEQYFLRPASENALDASAFQYSVYRSLTRWLGMDGALSVPFDIRTDFVDGWNDMVVNEDLLNPNTGKFDPRHMNGMTNHDVFRWPALTNGSEKLILGSVITELLMPGIPLLYYGEEQDFYMLDSTADNYLFGRQAMTSSVAWYLHGCYMGSSTQYPNIDVGKARNGCHDFWNALDHRDVSSASRNVFKAMHEIRTNYPVAKDGFCLTNLGNWTESFTLPASDAPTVVGLWSVNKAACPGQSLPGALGGQNLWFLYSNQNTTTKYEISCSSNDAILAPFPAGTSVQNLFYPHETYTLTNSKDPSTGCIASMHMDPWGFKVLVPTSKFVPRKPAITKLTPTHDQRSLSQDTGSGTNQTLSIEFSTPMDCDSIAKSISINSTTLAGISASLDLKSYTCQTYPYARASAYVGSPGSIFLFTSTLYNVYDGIHQIKIFNPQDKDKKLSTGTTDQLMFRVGLEDNPMVFPLTANYSSTVLSKNKQGMLVLAANAAGADQYRYSLDWGTTWSNWTAYNNEAKVVSRTAVWKGTKQQEWRGEHIIAQYWSQIAGSSSHQQSGDFEIPKDLSYRTFPHMFIMGPFNEWGYDGGARNEMRLDAKGQWRIPFISEAYPSELQFNVWGIDTDGTPDASYVYGTLANDTVLKRVAPSALSQNIHNISHAPDSPYLGWEVVVDDRTRRISVIPKGSRVISIIIYLLCLLVPPFTAILACLIFRGSFYAVKFNKDGRGSAKRFIPLRPMKKGKEDASEKYMVDPAINSPNPAANWPIVASGGARKIVLIATLEYNIEDWGIKIKIGGLGVMAQLMSQNLKHQDLIWVVPCVGDVNYPEAEYAPPMEVKILDQTYQINVMLHHLNNITYVLLDAPVFRRQSTIEPYPARMDDLESAIFYSAWNQCIAEAARRYPVDLYHINDYHGALAPLYLLPDLLPCALSLHNAEFQGLWPLRTPEERDEVCAVYNISPRICQKYVQFGNVFNLLHAGVSYLRIHQKGFGAVGVSNKYGKRSWARYPIFWGLKKIGKLPNPDPTDTADIGAPTVRNGKVTPNAEYEAAKKGFKRQAQEWAGLKVDPSADLLVFVGRWSMQKGIDLIADLVPTLVEEFNVQIITVGPIIDLYGKFAAEKLARLMEKYPSRVYSRPEFTALPPYIFSGADFTMIPSRDEPFGLVAVEFGRKGALGIGARVGGLGQMPGWWYTVESSATSHLLSQFESACRQALASNEKTRAVLRAKSALQRFPVQEWTQKLDALQAGCIKMCKKKSSSSGRDKSRGSIYSIFPPESSASVANVNNSQINLPTGFTNMPNASSPTITVNDDGRLPHGTHNYFAGPHEPQTTADPYAPQAGANLKRQLSLGSRRGPGHRTQPSAHLPRDPNGDLIAIDEEELYDNYQSETDNDDLFHPDSVRHAIGQGRYDSRTPSEDGYDSEDGFDPQRSTMFEVMDDDRDFSNPRNTFYGHSNASSSASLSQMANNYTRHGSFSSPPQTPPMSPSLSASQRNLIAPRFGNESRLSLASVMTGHNGKDFSLSKVQENFTDETGTSLRMFSAQLRDLTPKNSKDELCIEAYLVKAEKAFFADVRNEKLGFTGKGKKFDLNVSSRPGSISSRASSYSGPTRDLGSPESTYHPHSPLFTPPKPKGVPLLMMRQIGDWPLYSIILAVGQILAATSFQLTLLTSSTSQSAAQLYTIGIIFMFATVFWWSMYRLLPSVWCLSAPFVFYMAAFFIIGLPGIGAFHPARDWLNAVGTWFYAIASASGSLYFALNFGDEGAANTQTWIVRACLVQGTQQIWGSALWFWGEKLDADQSASKLAGTVVHTNPAVTGVVWLLAAIMLTFAYLLAVGLPDYYRQLPGRIPAFYVSLVRRKLVLWFVLATLLQNYWLSTLYGRSWRYLWGSAFIHNWAVLCLIVVFFIGIWGAVLFMLSGLSKTHSWVIPVFGVGLGAPRWAQMLWGTSNIGVSLPWAGAAGPYLGRALWLWLGVLDAVQGVGIGMILLQTLTRAHVATTLMVGQMVGAAAMLLGRATAPNAIGPGDTFLDFSTWSPSVDGLTIFASVAFWVCLACQIAVCVGYLVFFRKEQLSKP